MAIMEISVVPLGLGIPAWAIMSPQWSDICQQEGIPYELTDMGTLIHGHAARLLKVAQVLHELPFDQGVNRVVTHITIDDRRDKEVIPGRQRKIGKGATYIKVIWQTRKRIITRFWEWPGTPPWTRSRRHTAR